MTFSRCLRCNASFSSYKREEHQCRDLEESTND